MSTPVVQYYSPDPSLSTNAHFGQFIQYLITGTNYIVDQLAQVVYEFNPTVPGVLTQTAGSYTQFLAYLAANPVTSTIPNPNGPPGSASAFGFPYVFQSTPQLAGTSLQSVTDTPLYQLLEKILAELIKTRLATWSLATQGNVASEADFDPTTGYETAGESTSLFS